MKKILILVLPFLLTGCFGDAGKGYLTNTCTKTNDSNIIKDTTIYEILFKEDIIENITITYKYEGDNDAINNLKESYEYQNKNLERYGNFTFESNEDNGYQAIYKLEKKDFNDEMSNHFNLKEKRSKQVELLKELGYTCN